MEQTPGYSLVIPCYREDPQVVTATVDAIAAAMGAGTPYEILVVNDGGARDDFPEFARDTVRVLHHDVNLGYGASIMTGILQARYEWIGIADADGTYPIDHFGRLLAFTPEYDMVVGQRNPAGIPLLRRFPKYLLRKLASYLVDYDIADLNSGMRVFRKSIVLSYRKLFPKRFSFTTTLTMICIMNFFKIRFVDIPYFGRIGNSAIKPVRDTVRFFSLVFRLALYYKPLRFFIPLSGIVSLLAAARAVRDVILTNHFGGLTLVLFFMAFQLFFFGLIAEAVSKK